MDLSLPPSLRGPIAGYAVQQHDHSVCFLHLIFLSVCCPLQPFGWISQKPQSFGKTSSGKSSICSGE